MTIWGGQSGQERVLGEIAPFVRCMRPECDKSCGKLSCDNSPLVRVFPYDVIEDRMQEKGNSGTLMLAIKYYFLSKQENQAFLL